jgi:hypothetical protein
MREETEISDTRSEGENEQAYVPMASMRICRPGCYTCPMQRDGMLNTCFARGIFEIKGMSRVLYHHDIPCGYQPRASFEGVYMR